MFHLRIMVRQMLAKENVANLKEWEDVLLKLALRVASYLTFNPRAPGASMDVRQYVKIKKIPGGLPKDSEYVDGAVITKNVAHKQMLRNIKNPRIMLLTFPFDYHRVEGQFMSFQPLLAQEKEYLNNLVSRVAALRPHVVLVERSVSRLALESLLQANIAVARQVKPSALQFVSRVTQAQVISSMDRLALEPHMGQCSRFRIQTFEHALIPGRRKTYMRFEGCSREMGCTIVLRGENLQTLKRIKAVTSFMVFIVRNLKLETFLWKDLVISMPPVSTDAAPSMFLYSSIYGPHPSFMPRSSSRTPMSASAPLPRLSPPRELPEAEVDLSEEDLPDEEAARLRLSRRIQNSVEPYLSTFISASATLRFPPPYPIWRMKELDDKLEKVKRAWEDEEAALILQAERRHAQETTITQASALMDSPGATSPGSVGTPGLTRTPMGSESNASPNPTDPPPAYFDQNIANLPSRDSYMSIPSSRSSSLIKSSLQDPPLAVPVAVHEVAEIAKQSALVRARAEHEEHSRVWEWYLRKNDDDFLVQKYQCICIRHFIVPTLELTLEKACFMPQLKYMTYYGENDQTLGQFIEDCVVEAHDTKKVCPGKGCKKLMVAHSNVYVHNQTRVLVAAEPWKGQIGTKKAGATPVYDKITTFSYCRVCGQATPFIPISEEALKYSFAKFLELHFYPADVLLMHGAGCEHNIYQHHVRYFAWHGMTIRFQTDPVDLYEVTFPPMRSRVRLETLLEFKNRDYENMLLRNAAYWESVLAKIKQLQTLATTALDISSQEKGTGPLTNAVNDLMQRAEEDRAQILNMIHHTYQQSPPSDTLALGSVRSSIQDKVVQWDIDFERFEKNFLPVKAFLNIEKDLRTMTRTHHFKRLYDDFFGNASSASDMEGKSYIRTERPLDLLAASSASENESAPDEKLAYTSEPEELTAPKAPDQEATPSPQLPPITIPSEVNLDPDSDSTISAARTRPDTSPAEPTSVEQQADAGEARKSVVPYASRLPRWTRTNPSVADLVKQFQSLLPDNETFAEDPLKSMSESDREADAQPKRRPRVKAPLAKKSLPKQVVTSDFESSYAYNAGPRHFTHNKRNAPNALADVISRIPGPVTTVKNSPTDSRSPSRRPTVDDSGKQGRPSGVTTSTVKSRMGRPSPYDTDGGAASIRSGKGKGVSRLGRDKPTPRPAAPPSSMRPVSRRVPTQSAGNRVSTLARQFERLSKDTERVNRRYAVMRGRRARPPAIARAKVEIFDNIRDAVRDGSDESSSSSSEADDEDDGDDETRRKKSDDTNESANPALLVVENTSTEASTSSLEPQEATSATVESPTSMNNASNEVSSNTSPDPSVPPTPFIHHGDYSKERHPLSESETGSTAADQQSFINNLSSWLKPNTNEVSLQYPS
jgi:1-phosphatidylinositol-3-phosphate 5-kinase